MKSKHNALAALAAAASIPLTAQAEVTPEDQVIAYRYSQYSEDDNPRERTITPETGRYDIEVHQLRHARPLGEDWYIDGQMQYETLSGASPLQTYEEDGKSVLVTSGATIDEQRFDLKVSPKRYFDDGSLGGTVAYSTENDYESIALGADGSLELFDKHTTLLASFSASYDTLSPTDIDEYPAREEFDGKNKRIVSLYQGVSQVIDKNRVIQVGAGLTHLSGYLSDPYKTYDLRPDERDQFTISALYRHFLNVGDGAALHADYRLYSDDWGIFSHTLTARWAQSFNTSSMQFLVTPLVRYYRQTEADFYTLERFPADEFYSSDSRLSAFGAITIGLDTRAQWQNWTLSLDMQYYTSDEELGLIETSDTETPSLLTYTILSFGAEYRY